MHIELHQTHGVPESWTSTSGDVCTLLGFHKYRAEVVVTFVQMCSNSGRESIRAKRLPDLLFDLKL